MLARTRLLTTLALITVLTLLAWGLFPVNVTVAATVSATAPASALAATATMTPTVAVTNTVVTAPVTATATKVATATAVPPTATKVVVPPTATAIAVPPTATKVVVPATTTATKVPPTATNSPTLPPPTATKTAVPPTSTPVLPRAAAPRAGTVSSLSTSFAIQNMDPTSANVTATFYDATGSSNGTSSPSIPSLAQYRNAIIDQRTSGGGLGSQSSWQGAVVLNSNTQLAAVVNEYGGTSALGSGFRFDVYTGLSANDVDNTIILPTLFKNTPDSLIGASYNSTVAIQNTGNSAISNATITYYNTPCSPTTQSRTLPSIPANSAYVLDMQNELSCVTGTAQGYWLGAATISSPSQKVAVVVNQNSVGSLEVYRGFSPTLSGGQRLLLPQILNQVVDQNGFTYATSFVVMVADQTSANITATFYGDQGSFSITKTASPMALFDQRYDLQGRFFGSAIVTASGNKSIVGLVTLQTNYLNGRGVQTDTSRGFPDTSGKTTAFAPEILKTYQDSSGVRFSTGQLIQFTGSTAPVTITYYPTSGSAPFSTVVNPNPGSPLVLLDQRYDSQVPDNFVGAAYLTSSQPFVASVTVTGGNSDPGDTAGIYQAISR